MHRDKYPLSHLESRQPLSLNSTISTCNVVDKILQLAESWSTSILQQDASVFQVPGIIFFSDSSGLPPPIQKLIDFEVLLLITYEGLN